MTNNLVTIRVWGDFACFTRPEMKVERVSYSIMTPSAARGILEAIFWEPQIYYLIDAIHVIKRGRWCSFRRNEVISVISIDSTKTWMKSPEKVSPIQAGGGAPDGTQRNMLALQDVEYLVTAEVRLTEIGRQSGETIQKYRAEIERRAKSGKCYHRPALGMREFAADFEFEQDAQTALERRGRELGADWHSYNEDIGLMLYDVFAPEARAHGFRWLREGEHLADPHAHPGRQTVRKKNEVTPRSIGTLLQPEAVFFFADVQQARLDCHPTRARFARNRITVE
ncbi:MAG: type I-C CRISPR-associated protein Cas5c [Acidobacteriales bacterium]|nr:type I-C CRISPR-associated protein Cas5c [Terriglobales bacterium]